jgi:hypothetical protein
MVLRFTGSEAVLHLPQCDRQDQAVLAAAGVEAKSRFECIVDRVANPAGLFRGLELGEPISKLVRE